MADFLKRMVFKDDGHTRLLSPDGEKEEGEEEEITVESSSPPPLLPPLSLNPQKSAPMVTMTDAERRAAAYFQKKAAESTRPLTDQASYLLWKRIQIAFLCLLLIVMWVVGTLANNWGNWFGPMLLASYVYAEYAYGTFLFAERQRTMDPPSTEAAQVDPTSIQGILHLAENGLAPSLSSGPEGGGGGGGGGTSRFRLLRFGAPGSSSSSGLSRTRDHSLAPRQAAALHGAGLAAGIAITNPFSSSVMNWTTGALGGSTLVFLITTYCFLQGEWIARRAGLRNQQRGVGIISLTS